VEDGIEHKLADVWYSRHLQGMDLTKGEPIFEGMVIVKGREAVPDQVLD